MSRRAQPITPPKDKKRAFFAPILLHVSDIKVRKSSAPPTRAHTSKAAYRRKPKHPKREEE